MRSSEMPRQTRSRMSLHRPGAASAALTAGQARPASIGVVLIAEKPLGSVPSSGSLCGFQLAPQMNQTASASLEARRTMHHGFNLAMAPPAVPRDPFPFLSADVEAR